MSSGSNNGKPPSHNDLEKKRSISSPAATCASPPTRNAGPPRKRWKKPSRTPSKPKATPSSAPILILRPAAARLPRLAERRHGGLRPASTPKRPVIVAEAVWQYSHHVLSGLITHRGPILTVANWSGTWPGLVGMLNLNGSLTKAGVKYSTLWSEDFTDEYFRDRACTTGSRRASARTRREHVTPLGKPSKSPPRTRKLGKIARPPTADRKSHHGRVRRRLHGHVQRHHSRPPAQSHRRLQRTAQPVGPVLRDRRRSATTRPTPSATGWKTAA